MFYKFPSLISLDLSSFNTQNVNDMAIMFGNDGNEGSSSLKNLDLSSFNTKSVLGDSKGECSNLTTLNLSSFNTDISCMFYGCSKYHLKLERLLLWKVCSASAHL